MDPICPACGRQMVEVDNPIRREIRHRRGEETQCPAWREAAGLPPLGAPSLSHDEIVLAAIAIARMTGCIVSVGRYEGSPSSVEFWQPIPGKPLPYRYWAFLPKAS